MAKQVLTVRVDVSELAEWRLEAKRAGMALGEWMRSRLSERSTGLVGNTVFEPKRAVVALKKPGVEVSGKRHHPTCVCDVCRGVK